MMELKHSAGKRSAGVTGARASDKKSATMPKSARKRSQIVYYIVAVVIIVVIVVSCLLLLRKPSNKAADLLGTWSYNDEATYSFDDAGNGCLVGNGYQFTYTYKVEDEKLLLDYADESVEDAVYSFSVKKDRLIIEGKEGTDGGRYHLTRVE